jgi:hypothetical protein
LAPEDGVIGRLVAAAAMLVAAVFLVLLARDVWHWDRAIHDADARAAVAPISDAAWRSQSTLPAALTRRLLGINDDLVFRRAMVQAIRTASRPATTSSQKQRSILETTLARIARDDPDKARASRAADYLGVLLYSDPPTPDQAANAYQDPTQSGPSNQLTPEQKAMVQFLNAVRLDPGNDNAQRNLERMLHQPQPPPHQGSPQPGGGDKFGHKGSGARPPGHGY